MVTYLEKVARGDKPKPKIEKAEPKPRKVVVLETQMTRPTRATDDIKPAFGRVYGGSIYTRDKGGAYGDGRIKKSPAKKES